MPTPPQYYTAALLGLAAISAFKSASADNTNTNTGPSKDTCVGASMFFQELYTFCPKICEEEKAEDDRPKCTAGQNPYSSCGTNACGEFLKRVTDQYILQVDRGLKRCTGEMASVLALWTPDLGKFLVKERGIKCGKATSVKVSSPSKDTCYGAASFFLEADGACPKTCTSSNEDKSPGLPTCSDNEDERQSATCGTSECGNFLAGLSGSTLSKLNAGVKSCKNIAHMQNVNISTSYISKEAIVSIAQSCDKVDKLPFSPEYNAFSIKYDLANGGCDGTTGRADNLNFKLQAGIQGCDDFVTKFLNGQVTVNGVPQKRCVLADGGGTITSPLNSGACLKCDDSYRKGVACYDSAVTMKGKEFVEEFSNNEALQGKKKVFENEKQAILNEIASSNNETEKDNKRKEIKRKMDDYGADVAKQLQKQTKKMKDEVTTTGKSSESLRADYKNLVRKALDDAPTTIDKNGKTVFTAIKSDAKDLIDEVTRAKLKINEKRKYKMGSEFSPRTTRADAEANPADLSSLGTDEDAYVPLKKGEFVSLVDGGETYLIEQTTDEEIKVTANGIEKVLPVGECHTGNTKRLCSGSVVTAEKEDSTEASSGAPLLGSALSLIAAAAFLAVLF